MDSGRGKIETAMRNILWAIALTVLVAEIVTRVFYPELIQGESYAMDILRLLLGSGFGGGF